MSTEHRAHARSLALVTGASTGIGKAIARELVEHRYDVVVAAEEPEIEAAAAELEVGDAVVIPVQVDLATREGVEELYRRAREDGRPIGVVVLNAGVGVNGRFDRNRLDDELNLVDLNVRSTVHLTHLAVRDMVARRKGRVLVTSSIAAVAPGPYQATYAASKAFVHSFAQGIRAELRDTGVTVTSLMPGPTETRFFSRADMEDTMIARMAKDDPRTVARDAYAAMMAGKASVVTGSVMNRVQAELGTHLPDVLAAPLAALIAKPREARSAQRR